MIEMGNKPATTAEPNRGMASALHGDEGELSRLKCTRAPFRSADGDHRYVTSPMKPSS